MKAMAIFFALLISWSHTVQASPADIEAKAQKLVEQLASDSFRTREIAARGLIQLGADSKNALEKGCQSNDPEVANRCQKLLPLAYEFYVHKILEEYLARADGVLPEELPGAKRWRELAGPSKESTELYIAMLNAHLPLLLQVTEKPHSVTEIYRKHVQELYQRVRPSGDGVLRNNSLTDPELTLFLFLASDPKLNRNATEVGVNSYMPTYYILNQARWTTLLGKKDGSPVYKSLFVAFLDAQSNSNVIRRALQLAVTAEMKESIPVALRLAKEKNTIGTIRGYAITALSKLGTKENIADLMPFLEDTTVVANVRFNNEMKQIEMRDIALGVSLMLCNQTMTDYGYDRNPPNYANSSISVSYIYFSFASEEKRDEAMKKWKAYATKEKFIK